MCLYFLQHRVEHLHIEVATCFATSPESAIGSMGGRGKAECARAIRLLKKAQQPWHRAKKGSQAPVRRMALGTGNGKKGGCGTGSSSSSSGKIATESGGPVGDCGDGRGTGSSTSSGKIATESGGPAGDLGPCAVRAFDDCEDLEIENIEEPEDALTSARYREGVPPRCGSTFVASFTSIAPGELPGELWAPGFSC